MYMALIHVYTCFVDSVVFISSVITPDDDYGRNYDAKLKENKKLNIEYALKDYDVCSNAYGSYIRSPTEYRYM